LTSIVQFVGLLELVLLATCTTNTRSPDKVPAGNDGVIDVAVAVLVVPVALCPAARKEIANDYTTLGANRTVIQSLPMGLQTQWRHCWTV
jgi:hypothetical protein